MLDIVLSNHFKKDLKLAARRGYRLELLDEAVSQITKQETLPRNIEIRNEQEIMPAFGNVIFNRIGCLYIV